MRVFSLFVLSAVAVVFSSDAQAKQVKRAPSSSESVIVKVKAASLEDAWKKISANPKVAAVIKKVAQEQKDCDGQLGGFSQEHVMMYYSGRGGPAESSSRHLIPFFGGCGGTGMIDKVVLLANVANYVNIDEDNSDYHFLGFTRVKNLPINAADQGTFDGL